MLKAIEKVPAGTFLVPMLVSALFYTLSPDLFKIGGVTEALFSGSGLNFIVGALTFVSGIGLDIRKISGILKRHGIILLIKAIFCIALGLGAIRFLGEAGFWGISTVALIVAMCSINPAIYLSIVNQYGEEEDKGAFSLAGLFSIPLLPLVIYGLAGSGSFDFMPVLSLLLPLIIGIIIGSIDREWVSVFSPGTSMLMPFLGWNIGQGLNLIEATQSGFSGIILTVLFYVVMLLLMVGTDKVLLRNDGIIGLSLVTIAGVSASTPAILAQNNPAIAPFVESAVAQILTGVMITSVITPLLTGYVFKRIHGHAPVPNKYEKIN